MKKSYAVGAIAFLVGNIASLAMADHTCWHTLMQSWQRASRERRALIIGAPCTLAATYLLYRWITKEEPLENLYYRNHQLYRDLYEKYNNAHLLYLKSITAVSSEEELASLAMHPHSALLAAVAKDSATLQDAKRALQVRIQKKDERLHPFFTQIQTTIKDMQLLIAELEKLALFWQQHRAYFTYYNLVKDMAFRYEHERNVGTTPEALKRIIMARAAGTTTQYPYISFADNLKRDTVTLQYEIATIERYPVLYGTTRALYNELTLMLEMVVSLNEYAHELYVRKQHQLEEQKLSIERQRMEAEKAKADAMAKQATAERAKADALYQQAAAQQQQALMHTVQQTPQVTVNVQQPAPATGAPLARNLDSAPDKREQKERRHEGKVKVE